MERDQQASIKSVETSYFASTRVPRRVPKVTITMLKNPDAPSMEHHDRHYQNQAAKDATTSGTPTPTAAQNAQPINRPWRSTGRIFFAQKTVMMEKKVAQKKIKLDGFWKIKNIYKYLCLCCNHVLEKKGGWNHKRQRQRQSERFCYQNCVKSTKSSFSI